MATYQDIFISLNNLGILDIFVPFLLIFPIVFAIAQKTKILGESKKLNVTLALVIALIVIVPHVTGSYPPGTDVVQIINSALPGVSLALVGALAFVLLLGFFAKDVFFGNEDGSTNIVKGAVSIIAVGLVIAIFGNAAGWWQATGMFSFLSDPTTQALIVVLAVFWIVISSIISEEPKDDKAREAEAKSKFLYKLGDFAFKKK